LAYLAAAREPFAMYSFFITIHARPADVASGPQIEIDGRVVQTLALAPAVIGAATMDCSFESACERLTELERMYCEPDGSFVWTSSHDELAWQVEGNLYDRQQRLLFVNVKGSCPPQRFDELLASFGWPQTQLVFQLTRQAVFLDEAEFRRFALTAT
jgi:hypothetical protein